MDEMPACVLRGRRWPLGVAVLLCACVASLIVLFLVLHDPPPSLHRPDLTVALVVLACVAALTAVMCGWAWARHERLLPAFSADSRVLRLRVAPQAALELPWDSLRAVTVSRRALGTVVSVQPLDPADALTRLPEGARRSERLGGVRRPGGWFETPAMTGVRTASIAPALDRLAAGRCQVRRIS